jgi:hypothetical protein
MAPAHRRREAPGRVGQEERIMQRTWMLGGVAAVVGVLVLTAAPQEGQMKAGHAPDGPMLATQVGTVLEAGLTLQSIIQVSEPLTSQRDGGGAVRVVAVLHAFQMGQVVLQYSYTQVPAAVTGSEPVVLTPGPVDKSDAKIFAALMLGVQPGKETKDFSKEYRIAVGPGEGHTWADATKESLTVVAEPVVAK